MVPAVIHESTPVGNGKSAATEHCGLADQIRAIADERNKLDKKSPEYQALQKKLQPLMEKYKATAPK